MDQSVIYKVFGAVTWEFNYNLKFIFDFDLRFHSSGESPNVSWESAQNLLLFPLFCLDSGASATAAT